MDKESLKKIFGTDVPEEIVSKKTDGAQSKVFSAKRPQLVRLSPEECKRLCDAAGINYKAGYENRVLQYTITNETVDRYGDIVRAKGVSIKNYKKNPVVNFSHDTKTFPVGNTIRIWNEDTAVKAWSLFADDDVDKTGMADTVFRFASSGFMKACSIGFLPLESRRPSKDERESLGMGEYGVEYLKSDLLEWSCVSVPANPDAVQNSFDGVEKRHIEIAKSNEIFNTETLDIIEKMISGQTKDIDGAFRALEMAIGKDEGEGEAQEEIVPDDETTPEEPAEEEPPVEDVPPEEVEKSIPGAVGKPGYDETENMIRYRVREPNLFRDGTMRTVPIKKDKPRVNSVMGKLKANDGKEADPMVVQNLMFPKEDGWDVDKAKAWVKDHKDLTKSLEMLPEIILSCLEHPEAPASHVYLSSDSCVSLNTTAGTSAFWHWNGSGSTAIQPYTLSYTTAGENEKLTELAEEIKSLKEKVDGFMGEIQEKLQYVYEHAKSGAPADNEKLYEDLLEGIDNLKNSI